MKYLKENVGFVKKLIDGKPTVVIKNGEVLVENCAKKVFQQMTYCLNYVNLIFTILNK